jgi:hypothetical protein
MALDQLHVDLKPQMGSGPMPKTAFESAFPKAN